MERELDIIIADLQMLRAGFPATNDRPGLMKGLSTLAALRGEMEELERTMLSQIGWLQREAETKAQLPPWGEHPPDPGTKVFACRPRK